MFKEKVVRGERRFASRPLRVEEQPPVWPPVADRRFVLDPFSNNGGNVTTIPVVAKPDYTKTFILSNRVVKH